MCAMEKEEEDSASSAEGGLLGHGGVARGHMRHELWHLHVETAGGAGPQRFPGYSAPRSSYEIEETAPPRDPAETWRRGTVPGEDCWAAEGQHMAQTSTLHIGLAGEACVRAGAAQRIGLVSTRPGRVAPHCSTNYWRRHKQKSRQAPLAQSLFCSARSLPRKYGFGCSVLETGNRQ
jgi:hypothetical protein